MHWVIALSLLRLKRLVADDALRAVCVMLHQRASDRKIGGVTDHIQWSVVVFNRQYGRLHQALLDTFKERWHSAFYGNFKVVLSNLER